MKSFAHSLDISYSAMIKYVSMRWLSLESAVSRILSKYAGLKSYFLSNDDSNARFKRLQEHFKNPMTEVHLHCRPHSVEIVDECLNRDIQVTRE